MAAKFRDHKIRFRNRFERVSSSEYAPNSFSKGRMHCSRTWKVELGDIELFRRAPRSGEPFKRRPTAAKCGESLTNASGMIPDAARRRAAELRRTADNVCTTSMKAKRPWQGGIEVCDAPSRCVNGALVFRFGSMWMPTLRGGADDIDPGSRKAINPDDKLAFAARLSGRERRGGSINSVTKLSRLAAPADAREERDLSRIGRPLLRQPVRRWNRRVASAFLLCNDSKQTFHDTSQPIRSVIVRSSIAFH